MSTEENITEISEEESEKEVEVENITLSEEQTESPVENLAELDECESPVSFEAEPEGSINSEQVLLPESKGERWKLLGTTKKQRRRNFVILVFGFLAAAFFLNSIIVAIGLYQVKSAKFKIELLEIDSLCEKPVRFHLVAVIPKCSFVEFSVKDMEAKILIPSVSKKAEALTVNIPQRLVMNTNKDIKLDFKGEFVFNDEYEFGQLVDWIKSGDRKIIHMLLSLNISTSAFWIPISLNWSMGMDRDLTTKKKNDKPLYAIESVEFIDPDNPETFSMNVNLKYAKSLVPRFLKVAVPELELKIACLNDEGSLSVASVNTNPALISRQSDNKFSTGFSIDTADADGAKQVLQNVRDGDMFYLTMKGINENSGCYFNSLMSKINMKVSMNAESVEEPIPDAVDDEDLEDASEETFEPDPLLDDEQDEEYSGPLIEAKLSDAILNEETEQYKIRFDISVHRNLISKFFPPARRMELLGTLPAIFLNNIIEFNKAEKFIPTSFGIIEIEYLESQDKEHLEFIMYFTISDLTSLVKAAWKIGREDILDLGLHDDVEAMENLLVSGTDDNLLSSLIKVFTLIVPLDKPSNFRIKDAKETGAFNLIDIGGETKEKMELVTHNVKVNVTTDESQISVSGTLSLNELDAESTLDFIRFEWEDFKIKLKIPLEDSAEVENEEENKGKEDLDDENKGKEDLDNEKKGKEDLDSENKGKEDLDSENKGKEDLDNGNKGENLKDDNEAKPLQLINLISFELVKGSLRVSMTRGSLLSLVCKDQDSEDIEFLLSITNELSEEQQKILDERGMLLQDIFMDLYERICSKHLFPPMVYHGSINSSPFELVGSLFPISTKSEHNDSLMSNVLKDIKVKLVGIAASMMQFFIQLPENGLFPLSLGPNDENSENPHSIAIKCEISIPDIKIAVALKELVDEESVISPIVLVDMLPMKMFVTLTDSAFGNISSDIADPPLENIIGFRVAILDLEKALSLLSAEASDLSLTLFVPQSTVESPVSFFSVLINSIGSLISFSATQSADLATFKSDRPPLDSFSEDQLKLSSEFFSLNANHFGGKFSMLIPESCLHVPPEESENHENEKKEEPKEKEENGENVENIAEPALVDEGLILFFEWGDLSVEAIHDDFTFLSFKADAGKASFRLDSNLQTVQESVHFSEIYNFAFDVFFKPEVSFNKIKTLMNNLLSILLGECEGELDEKLLFKTKISIDGKDYEYSFKFKASLIIKMLKFALERYKKNSKSSFSLDYEMDINLKKVHENYILPCIFQYWCQSVKGRANGDIVEERLFDAEVKMRKLYTSIIGFASEWLGRLLFKFNLAAHPQSLEFIVTLPDLYYGFFINDVNVGAVDIKSSYPWITSAPLIYPGVEKKSSPSDFELVFDVGIYGPHDFYEWRQLTSFMRFGQLFNYFEDPLPVDTFIRPLSFSIQPFVGKSNGLVKVSSLFLKSFDYKREADMASESQTAQSSLVSATSTNFVVSTKFKLPGIPKNVFIRFPGNLMVDFMYKNLPLITVDMRTDMISSSTEYFHVLAKLQWFESIPESRKYLDELLGMVSLEREMDIVWIFKLGDIKLSIPALVPERNSPSKFFDAEGSDPNLYPLKKSLPYLVRSLLRKIAQAKKTGLDHQLNKFGAEMPLVFEFSLNNVSNMILEVYAINLNAEIRHDDEISHPVLNNIVKYIDPSEVNMPKTYIPMNLSAKPAQCSHLTDLDAIMECARSNPGNVLKYIRPHEKLGQHQTIPMLLKGKQFSQLFIVADKYAQLAGVCLRIEKKNSIFLIGLYDPNAKQKDNVFFMHMEIEIGFQDISRLHSIACRENWPVIQPHFLTNPIALSAQNGFYRLVGNDKKQGLKVDASSRFDLMVDKVNFQLELKSATGTQLLFHLNENNLSFQNSTADASVSYDGSEAIIDHVRFTFFPELELISISVFDASKNLISVYRFYNIKLPLIADINFQSSKQINAELSKPHDSAEHFYYMHSPVREIPINVLNYPVDIPDVAVPSYNKDGVPPAINLGSSFQLEFNVVINILKGKDVKKERSHSLVNKHGFLINFQKSPNFVSGSKSFNYEGINNSVGIGFSIFEDGLTLMVNGHNEPHLQKIFGAYPNSMLHGSEMNIAIKYDAYVKKIYVLVKQVYWPRKKPEDRVSEMLSWFDIDLKKYLNSPVAYMGIFSDQQNDYHEFSLRVYNISFIYAFPVLENTLLVYKTYSSCKVGQICAGMVRLNDINNTPISRPYELSMKLKSEEASELLIETRFDPTDLFFHFEFTPLMSGNYKVLLNILRDEWHLYKYPLYVANA